MVSDTYIEQEKGIPSFNEYFEWRAPSQDPLYLKCVSEKRRKLKTLSFEKKGCSKKSNLKNLKSGVGTLDFWTNVGHPGHLGCLCQFEPLWPKKILLTMFGTQCV